MLSRSLGYRAPLLWFVIPFMAGIVAGRLVDGVPLLIQLGAALAAAIAAFFVSFTGRPGWSAAIVAAAFLSGSASYELHRLRLRAWDTLPPREAVLSIRVERTFASSIPGRVSGLGRITSASGPVHDIQGQRVYFSCAVPPRSPMPRRSMVVSMAGVLTPLAENPPADSFDGYLAGAGANFRLGRARLLEVVSPQQPYYRFCDKAATRFRTILGLGIEMKAPTLTGLLRAMMLGETRELTEDQHTVFMQSGTMHLFAISGLNIGVIAMSIQALLLLARLPLWIRFAIGTTLLWLFVDITGGSPSAVRAFVMAAFIQSAFVFRKPASLLAAIVASAAIVLVTSPLQLFSASFIMSYAIVICLLLLGLPLAEVWSGLFLRWSNLPRGSWGWWHKVTYEAWNKFAGALAVGVATTLASVLTSIQFFRLLTPGALLANLILVPAATVVTVGGFVSLVCGLLGFSAGAVVSNHAAALVLKLIETLVRSGVEIPGAFLTAKFHAPWIGGAALATVLATVLLGYGAKWQPRYGSWWPPIGVVALTLIAGVKYGG